MASVAILMWKKVYVAYIGLEQKFVVFFSFKISIFYKISMTPFDRAKFQLSDFFFKLRYNDF